MVARNTQLDATISRMKAIVSGLPPDIANVTFMEDEHEFQIDVMPRSENLCAFWLGLSCYGAYTLCFGHGLAFEELSLQEFPPDDVARAIMAGNVRETVWLSGGRISKAVGSITLGDGRVLSDNAVLGFRGLLCIGERKDISYCSYQQ